MIYALLALAILSVAACFVCYVAGYKRGLEHASADALDIFKEHVDAGRVAVGSIHDDASSVQNDPDNRDGKSALHNG